MPVNIPSKVEVIADGYTQLKNSLSTVYLMRDIATD